jgi:translation elongation factor P/translation initiation factor 5A|tara:strand:+ start:1303 stop:1428 length:126 start_codon:yes stop_codon:yes gene_type:complete
MVIHNEIFDTYRIKQKQIEEAIQLLKENGYAIYKKVEKEVV